MANTIITPVKGLKATLSSEIAMCDATKDTADGTEVFEFPAGKSFALAVSSILVGVKLTFSTGDGWAGKAVEVTTANKNSVIVVESARCVKDGKITVTATPASGKKLKSEHALALAVIEL